MSALYYYVTAPVPAVRGTDAVHQDVDALRDRFGGRVVHLYPFRRPGLPWPRIMVGAIGRPPGEPGVRLHHVLASDLHPYRWLRDLRQPVVYSVLASIQDPATADPAAFGGVAALVASSERDAALLRRRGFEQVRLIRPGIELRRFQQVLPPPLGDGFVLLAGSAPWIRSQFRSKGIDALLEACRALPRLRLVFLWRGRLRAALERRVRCARMNGRVEILDAPADVPATLARVHAAVVLADGPTLVKAYPHSLLEALAAGRPVVVSDAVPMADYVRETGCGVVTLGVSPAQVVAALARLIEGYARYQACAAADGARTFSRAAMLDAYATLYNEVASPPTSRSAR